VLQLIPEQAAKMRPVFERRRTEVNTLAQTTREQLRDIRERVHADLRSILRPEQWEQFLQLETRRLEAARRQTATPTGRNASTISSQR
jgi:Spy/CpxP family protein refolding chaperone